MNDTNSHTADARAAEAIGWTQVREWDFGSGGVQWRGLKPGGRTPQPLPAFGSDPAAARALLEAVPAGEGLRARVVRLLAEKVGLGLAGDFVGHIWYADELFTLLLAPPAAIRDAVLEVMSVE